MRAVKLHILKTRRGYNFLAHRFIVITPLLTTNYDRVKWISFIQLCEINFPFQRYTLLDSFEYKFFFKHDSKFTSSLKLGFQIKVKN